MTVFDDLRVLKTKCTPYSCIRLSKQQYNFLVNDKRTFKERLKDTIKLLRLIIKCQKNT